MDKFSRFSKVLQFTVYNFALVSILSLLVTYISYVAGNETLRDWFGLALLAIVVNSVFVLIGSFVVVGIVSMTSWKDKIAALFSPTLIASFYYLWVLMEVL